MSRFTRCSLRRASGGGHLGEVFSVEVGSGDFEKELNIILKVVHWTSRWVVVSLRLGIQNGWVGEGR